MCSIFSRTVKPLGLDFLEDRCWIFLLKVDDAVMLGNLQNCIFGRLDGIVHKLRFFYKFCKNEIGKCV